MTEYVILISTRVDSQKQEWLEIQRISARSAHSALREANVQPGEYVAVPARSWRPVTVKVETKTALKFS